VSRSGFWFRSGGDAAPSGAAFSEQEEFPMPRFLLMVNHDNGAVDTPMDEWTRGEIAARVSAVPGPGGVSIRQPVEVRQVMGESGDEL
jgi:hypothetical protein